MYSLRKTCNGCRADNNQKFCDLGFERETSYLKSFCITRIGKPLEKCPKPRTYDDYVYCLKTENRNENIAIKKEVGNE